MLMTMSPTLFPAVRWRSRCGVHGMAFISQTGKEAIVGMLGDGDVLW